MPYRKPFPIPSEINPLTSCLCLQIPDNDGWRTVIAGLLSELQYWYNWERDGTNNGSQCAAVWKSLYTDIDWTTMSCCCDEIIILYVWTEDGELEQSTDGGVTYEPVPEKDPRNNSPVYPPVPGEPSEDKNCIAATGMSLLVKEGIGDQLTAEMGRYTLGQLIHDWITTVIQTSNPFEALIQIITNQIFALLISAVISALTEEVYDKLKCAFYCNMEDDLSFNDAGWVKTRSDILDQIAGIAGVFLEHLVFLLGKVGLTNLARSQAATEGDCTDCVCDDSCGGMYSLYGTWGNVTEVTSDSITIEATFDGPNIGGYVAGIKADDINECCYLTYEVVSGTITNFNSAWANCEEDSTWPELTHTGLHTEGCDSMQARYSNDPFTIRFLLNPCP